MAKITDIKQQKRSEGRFSVYVDGKYSFSLNGLELGASGARVGQELSDAELEKIRGEGEAAKAYDRAIRYLSYRPRSMQEVRVYLERKGFEGDLVEGVLQRLQAAGLVGDRQFAASWVENRRLMRPRSRRMLAQELRAKGVSSEEIDTVLQDAMQDDGELVMLREVIEKKRRLPQYEDKQKLMAFLARQGYPYELVKRALND